MNKHAFIRGYEQVQKKDLSDVRSEIMLSLGVKTSAGFRKRLRGEVEPKVSVAQEIEEIFKRRGITEIWGE